MKKHKYDIVTIQGLIDRSTYEFNNGWFFPSDLIPHSTALKYACKRFVEKGLMEVSGEKGDRWGYKYRIIPTPSIINH